MKLRLSLCLHNSLTKTVLEHETNDKFTPDPRTTVRFNDLIPDDQEIDGFVTGYEYEIVNDNGSLRFVPAVLSIDMWFHIGKFNLVLDALNAQGWKVILGGRLTD